YSALFYIYTLSLHDALPIYNLISTSTPLGKSNFINASTVLAVGLTISIKRLCVRISNCSRESLYLCGERITVYTERSVGNGIGPTVCAPVLCADSTILFADTSRARCS